MGANTTAAFTDYVTHLIAEEHGGAKYWVGDVPREHTLFPINTILVCS
jgi:twin BRCT domain